MHRTEVATRPSSFPGPVALRPHLAMGLPLLFCLL